MNIENLEGSLDEPGSKGQNGVLVLLSAYAKTGSNPLPDLGAFLAINGKIVNTHFTSRDEILLKKKELVGTHPRKEFE